MKCSNCNSTNTIELLCKSCNDGLINSGNTCIHCNGDVELNVYKCKECDHLTDLNDED